MIFHAHDYVSVAPSPPRGVEAFCSTVGWRVPRYPNGKITKYRVLLSQPGTGMTKTFLVESDRTFMAIPPEYQQIGTFIQVCA